MFVLYGALGAKLRELGHDTKSLNNIDGEYGLFSISVDDNGYSNRERKIRVQVQADRRIQFPESKKGFNLDKIAGAISAEIQRRKERQRQDRERRNRDQVNNEIFNRIVQENGFATTMGMVYEGPFRLTPNSRGFRVEFTQTFETEAEFRDFIAKAQKGGLLPRRTPEKP
jgi:hypothetical protein